MPTSTAISVGLSVLGTAVSAYGAYQQGQAAKAAAKAQQQEYNYEAAQMEQQAGQERAAAQRKAQQLTKEKNLAESKAIAINAASGGSSLDPSVVDVLGDLEAQGTYNANNARYEGESRATDLENNANLRRYGGTVAVVGAQNTANASNLNALGSVVSGASSMYGKYGETSPTKITWDDGVTTVGPRYG